MTTIRINYLGLTMDGVTLMDPTIEPTLVDGVYNYEVSADDDFGAYDPGRLPLFGQTMSLVMTSFTLIGDPGVAYGIGDSLRMIAPAEGTALVPPATGLFRKVRALDTDGGVYLSGLCVPIPRGYRMGFLVTEDKGPYMIQMTLRERKPQEFRCYGSAGLI